MAVSFLFVNNIYVHQNYFEYDKNFLKPAEGMAPGSPISGKKANIFLQKSEQH
jgi:hypothetical protein